MACSVVQTPEFTAIVCGLPAPKKCEFCGDPGDYLCDWPVEKLAKVPVGDLRAGDEIRVAGARRNPKIVYAQRDGELVYLAYDSGIGVNKFASTLDVSYQVVRMATCDSPCCENCLREVEPEVHYCRNHWDSWRQVA